MRRRYRHARVHVLLARRVDEPLSLPDEAAVEAHLAGCPACRSVAHEYETQRELLRGMRPVEPPRDLWARTATALDHEVARDRRRPSVLAWGSLASLIVMLALVASQAGLLQLPGPLEVAAATPIPVTPQPIAFITRQGNELTIYEAQVNEVCPPPRYDCTDRAADTRALLRVNASVDPSDLALGTGGRLVITGRDGDGHAIYSVLELPPSTPSDTPSTTSGSTIASQPPATSGKPGASASAPGSTSPGSTSPGSTPSSQGTTSPSTVITAPPSPSEAPSNAPALGSPILTDVLAAGAPAAWSPDGTALAFSAMPADSSHGPDIYTWHPGQPLARALTRDHRSWFASWVGNRILLSRTPATSPGKTPPASPAGSAAAHPGTADVVAQTFLVDPATGAARAVGLESAWLPSVDPGGRFAIYFQGTLLRDGAFVRPGAGRLLLIDWRTVDPFAPKPSSGPPAASPGRSAGAQPTAPAPAPPSHANATMPGPVAASQAGDASRPPPSSTPSPTPDDGTFTPYALDAPGVRIADWLVRWSADGSAYGLWVTATPDSEIGLLLVAQPRSQADRLLDATPALRAFSLGDGHVAWVSPTSDEDGELRVAAWGDGVSGGVRVRQVSSATLAF